MDPIKRYQEIKAKAEKLQREADRAAGIAEAKKAELKNEFGCNSLKEAKELLKQYETEEKETRAEFEKALADFEENWGDKL